MYADGIPQIELVLGSCSAGGTYIPAMGDESVTVNGNGIIFLAGPSLAKAATRIRSFCRESRCTTIHCKALGVSNYFTYDELHGLATGRNIIKNLYLAGKHVSMNVPQYASLEYKEPLYNVKELSSIAPTDLRQSLDVSLVIAWIVDGSEFDEFKKLHGTHL